MIADESIPSGWRSRPPSHPSVLAFSLPTSHGIIRRWSSPSPRPRSAQDQQVVGDHAETHPPLHHPQEASIPAASKAVAALHASRPHQDLGPYGAGLSLGGRTLWLAPDVETSNLALGTEIVAKGYEEEHGERWVVDLITITNTTDTQRRPGMPGRVRPRP